MGSCGRVRSGRIGGGGGAGGDNKQSSVKKHSTRPIRWPKLYFNFIVFASTITRHPLCAPKASKYVNYGRERRAAVLGYPLIYSNSAPGAGLRRRPALIKIRSAIKSSRYLRLVYERGRRAPACPGVPWSLIYVAGARLGSLIAEKLPSSTARRGHGADDAARHARCARKPGAAL